MTDVPTTPRKKLSPRERLAAWERHNGVCVLCCVKIDGSRERWICEHIRALCLGGSDTPDNIGPAHRRCADAKTYGAVGDLAIIAKAKRQKIAHIGAKQSKRALPFGKTSPWKKRIDGTVVRRGGE